MGDDVEQPAAGRGGEGDGDPLAGPLQLLEVEGDGGAVAAGPGLAHGPDHGRPPGVGVDQLGQPVHLLLDVDGAGAGGVLDPRVDLAADGLGRQRQAEPGEQPQRGKAEHDECGDQASGPRLGTGLRMPSPHSASLVSRPAPVRWRWCRAAPAAPSTSRGLVRKARTPLASSSLDLGRAGVGADDHHRDRGGRRVGPQPAQHLVAGHVGQVQVEQDQVRAGARGPARARAVPAWRRSARRPAGGCEDPLDQAAG